MAGELTVVSPATGEVIDLAVATDDHLAEAYDAAQRFSGQVDDFMAAARQELLRRMDADACWTRRIGDPKRGTQYEVSAPSPTAGTTKIDEAILERVLLEMVDDGVMSREAADRALEVSVTARFVLPVGVEHERLVGFLRAVDRIAETPVTVADVDVARKASRRGLTALVKRGGDIAAGILRAEVPATAPARKVKMTAKVKA